MTNLRILITALFAVALLAAATSVPVLGASTAAACQATSSSCGG
jgi:hypothetical protein